MEIDGRVDWTRCSFVLAMEDSRIGMGDLEFGMNDPSRDVGRWLPRVRLV
jgi:hypothetical protein